MSAVAALFVIHSSTLHSLQRSTIIILSPKRPNTPQRRLFDILTSTFQTSFPTRPQESAETRLCLENKSSFFFALLYNGRRDTLI